MFNLVSQKRTLISGTEPYSAGVFDETGLYKEEFIQLTDSISMLFNTVGADETERIMDQIWSEFEGMLSERFVVNLQIMIRRRANKLRASKAEMN